jgi:hypothetical protein
MITSARARVLRPGLGHQCRSGRPFAADTDSGARLQNQELPPVLHKSAQAGEDRIDQDSDDHRPRASDSIRGNAECDAAQAQSHQLTSDDKAARLRDNAGIS